MDGFKNLTYCLHPGIYVLLRKGEVMYVGKSTTPLRRIGQHSATIEYDQVWFKRCRREDLDELEWETIRKLRPRLNKDMVSPFVVPATEKQARKSVSLRINGMFLTMTKGGGLKVERAMEEVRRA